MNLTPLQWTLDRWTRETSRKECPCRTEGNGIPLSSGAEAVRLYHSVKGEKSMRELAVELGISNETLRSWIKQADMDAGQRQGLAIEERDELKKLRRKVRVLEEEREISRMSRKDRGSSQRPLRSEMIDPARNIDDLGPLPQLMPTSSGSTDESKTVMRDRPRDLALGPGRCLLNKAAAAATSSRSFGHPRKVPMPAPGRTRRQSPNQRPPPPPPVRMPHPLPSASRSEQLL